MPRNVSNFRGITVCVKGKGAQPTEVGEPPAIPSRAKRALGDDDSLARSGSGSPSVDPGIRWWVIGRRFTDDDATQVVVEDDGQPGALPEHLGSLTDLDGTTIIAFHG